MVLLNITSRDGEIRTLEASSGVSLMEILRDNGIDEVLALCGGCLSCASCHVYVREDFLGAFPPPSDEEIEMLEDSEYKQENSRLSCQLFVSDDIGELAITIPPEE